MYYSFYYQNSGSGVIIQPSGVAQSVNRYLNSMSVDVDSNNFDVYIDLPFIEVDIVKLNEFEINNDNITIEKNTNIDITKDC